jgi:hypothetical protein
MQFPNHFQGLNGDMNWKVLMSMCGLKSLFGTTTIYLNFLEQNLNTHLYHIIMLGNCNVPKYVWLNSTPLSNCYYYNKIKGNFIHMTACFLGLN